MVTNMRGAQEMILKATADYAEKLTFKAIEESITDSKLLSHDSLNHVGRINYNEVALGKYLGEGEFNVVLQAKIKDPSRSTFSSVGDDYLQEDSERQYAIKFLKISKVQKGKKFARGSRDLAMEAHFLASLNHPNVIKLHAIPEGGIQTNISRGTEGCFFLIIDKIDITLRQKLYRWKDQSEDVAGFLARISRDPTSTKRKSIFSTRLEVVQQLSSVLAYLHSKSIIYRDFKPDNIGFDENGVLKLFDFGTAKELKLKEEYYDGTYDLTAMIGSFRYMAPEVALVDAVYNLSADVYSFGVLAWQILALQAPFEEIDQGIKSYSRDRLRPKIDARGKHSHWPKKIRSLLAQCWNEDTSKRPSSEEILTTLGEKKTKYHQQGYKSPRINI